MEQLDKTLYAEYNSALFLEFTEECDLMDLSNYGYSALHEWKDDVYNFQTEVKQKYGFIPSAITVSNLWDWFSHTREATWLVSEPNSLIDRAFEELKRYFPEKYHNALLAIKINEGI